MLVLAKVPSLSLRLPHFRRTTARRTPARDILRLNLRHGPEDGQCQYRGCVWTYAEGPAVAAVVF